MSERVQAAMVAVFLLLIGAVAFVLLTRNGHEAPPARTSSHDPGNDLDSASKDPVGAVSLTAGKGDLLVRVMAGSCTTAGGPQLELSSNLGRTFRHIRVPQVDDGTGVSASSPAVRAIVFVEATSPTAISVGAADTKCAVHRYSTTDAGATWKQESAPLAQWYLDPKTGVAVSPIGRTDAGCKSGIGHIAPITKQTAKVFCASGTIRSTTDGGQVWTSIGKLADASAVVFTGARTGYATVAGTACKSHVYATVTGGATWLPRGCVVKELVIPGLTGTAKHLVSGGPSGVRLSTDDGKTWKAPTQP